MKRHFIAPIILVLLLLCSCERNRAYKADIAGGTADLTFVDFSGGQTAQLNGEWFYWPGELKQPEAVREAVESGYSHYVAVPSAWKRVAPFENNNNLLTSGTIALKITLPEEERTWSLRIPNASTAIKAYVNGSEIGEVGRAVPDREDYVPRNLPQIAEFYSSGGDTYIAFHVVNFISSSTGIWDYPAIGDSSAMHGRRQRSIVIVCLISGALIFMGLYHITLFLLRPEETSYIFFALICLFQSARNLIMNEKILTHLFPFTSGGWEAALVVEHLSVHMIIPLFYLFFKRLFPQQVHTYAVRFVLAVSGFWTLFEITTPAMVFQRFLPWFEYFILVSVLYMLAAIGRAFVARVEGAGITLVGLGILLLAGINDVLYSTGVIQSIFLTSTGVFIYLFIQAFYLSMSFARLFNMVSRYSAELKILNKSFERFIPREVLKLLNKSSIVDIELGDYIEDNMTVFFLDIRDFTTLSEAMSPNDTFRFINSFLFRIGPVIRENGGFIDKYIGDGIMALFPKSADDALAAALAIRNKLKELNQDRTEAGWKPVRVGIGIHTGPLMLGTIGENERMDSTVISDTVNTASRLEDLTKEMKTDIIISAECVKALTNPDRYVCYSIGTHQIRGKATLVNMYAVQDS